MRKLWAKLFKYSGKKYRDNYLENFGVDIKCPNCNEWFSISEIDYVYGRYIRYDWGDGCKCEKCGHMSYWNLVACPFPTLCDEHGTPLHVRIK